MENVLTETYDSYQAECSSGYYGALYSGERGAWRIPSGKLCDWYVKNAETAVRQIIQEVK